MNTVLRRYGICCWLLIFGFLGGALLRLGGLNWMTHSVTALRAIAPSPETSTPGGTEIPTGKELALSAELPTTLSGYPVQQAPPFRSETADTGSPSLAAIIAAALARWEVQGYPLEPVSISLVDLSDPCCAYAQYQDTQKRYPASIVKLFWAVALHGQYQQGQLTPADLLPDDEKHMLHESNNGASSRIVDALTQTESGDALSGAALQDWIAARQQLNAYFRAAGYTDINIGHKTFPIPDLDLSDPKGRDLQFFQGTPQVPATRNYLTTLATARLLYEIETGQAISPRASDCIKAHLKHSTDPDDWQSDEWNAIADFFGEGLPADVQLYTKLGYTFDDGRQEAAIIHSADGQTRFILVVFANDPIYSQSGSDAFPELARLVYDQMRSRTVPAAIPRGDRR